MAFIRWLLLAALAMAFLLLAVSNWTPVDFILPDGTPRPVPLPLLLAGAFLAGVLPTWAWLTVLRPLAANRRPRPERVERVEAAPGSSGA